MGAFEGTLVTFPHCGAAEATHAREPAGAAAEAVEACAACAGVPHAVKGAS